MKGGPVRGGGALSVRGVGSPPGGRGGLWFGGFFWDSETFKMGCLGLAMKRRWGLVVGGKHAVQDGSAAALTEGPRPCHGFAMSLPWLWHTIAIVQWHHPSSIEEEYGVLKVAGGVYADT